MRDLDQRAQGNILMRDLQNVDQRAQGNILMRDLQVDQRAQGNILMIYLDQRAQQGNIL
jgi:hypothetical protein